MSLGQMAFNKETKDAGIRWRDLTGPAQQKWEIIGKLAFGCKQHVKWDELTETETLKARLNHLFDHYSDYIAFHAEYLASFSQNELWSRIRKLEDQVTALQQQLKGQE